MYSEIEILAFVDQVVKIDKGQGFSWKKKKSEYPEYYPGYGHAVKMMDRIRTHSEISEFPEYLFREAAPRQNEKEFKYFKNNYKQTTLPVFSDFENTIERIFSDASWSIDYGKKDSSEKDSLQDYLVRDLPYYGSLEGYVKGIVKNRKLVDSNGVIAIKPKEIPSKVVYLEDGTQITEPDDTVKIDPIPVYYSCKQIVAEKLDEYYLIELQNEKSTVQVAGKDVQEGRVFEFYDRENIYKIKQFGEKMDNKFQAVLYFNHQQKKVPCYKLKGSPQVSEERLCFISPFMYAVDLLDLCILNHSVLQSVLYRIGYPHTVMLGRPCQFEYEDSVTNTIHVCNEGFVYENSVQIKCPRCLGSGLLDRLSPLGVLYLNPEKEMSGNNDSDFKGKPLEFVEPGTDNFRLLMEKIESDENKARQILHLKLSQSKVTANPQTLATTEILDMKSMYAFVRPISDQIFSLYENITNAIAYQRYQDNYVKPTFVYPTTFDFYTESDYVEKLKNAKLAGLPSSIIYMMVYSYIQGIYFNDQTTARVLNLILQTDRLLPLSNEEVQTNKDISSWERVLYTSGITLIGKLLDENENFFEQDFVTQQEQLVALAKSTADNVQKGNVLQLQQGANNRVNNILGNSAA